jgi:hypothetical protein
MGHIPAFTKSTTRKMTVLAKVRGIRHLSATAASAIRVKRRQGAGIMRP